MKIAVDIDGTISKTFEAFGEIAKKHGFDISGGPTEGAIYSKYSEVRTLYPNAPAQKLGELYEENWEDMRASYEMYPGAVFVLHSIENELHALTNRRLFVDENVCSVTRDWLNQHNVPVSSVIHTTDKAMVCKQKGFDLLIEDSVKNALPVAQTGTHVFLFDKPYNQHVPEHENITRFSHWIEIPRLLQRLSK